MVTRRSPRIALLSGLALLLLLAGGGCETETTEDETGVLLTISGDYAVPDEIDRLVLRIYDIASEDGARTLLQTEEYDLAAIGVSLPATLAILETRVPPATKLGFRVDAFGPDGVLPVAWDEWTETFVPPGSHAELRLALGDYPGLFQQGAGAAAVCRGIIDLTSADFDEDGVKDLAALCGDGVQRTIQALRSDGSGGLAAGWQAALPNCADCTQGSIAASPIRATVPADLFAGPESEDHLLRFAGSGDGQFATPAESIGAANYPIGLMIADADGDNHPDLIWLNLVDPAASQFSVLFGSSTGIATDGEQVNAGAARFPQAMAAADFDGDRDLDFFVVARGATAGQAPVGVLVRNDGGRAFSPGAELGIGAEAGDAAPAVAAGDFDGDEKLDVAVAVLDETDPSTGHNGFAVLWGKGDGSFEPAVFIEAGHENWAIAAADFNLDGIDDIALADRRDDLNDSWSKWGGVALFLGKGDREFELLDVVGTDKDHPKHPRALWIDDFNDDSHPDLAVGMAAQVPAGDEPVQILLARP